MIVLDELLPLIKELEAEGAVVLFKWDGERTSRKCTVVLSHAAQNFTFRRDSDDLAASFREAVADYRRKHASKKDV